MSPEDKIRYRIAEISRGTEIEYPASPELQRKHKRNFDLLDKLDTDYRKVIVEHLEWVLREVFQVTP